MDTTPSLCRGTQRHADCCNACLLRGCNAQADKICATCSTLYDKFSATLHDVQKCQGSYPGAGEEAEGEGENDGGHCRIGKGHNVDEHDHADLTAITHAKRRSRNHLVAVAARPCRILLSCQGSPPALF